MFRFAAPRRAVGHPSLRNSRFRRRNTACTIRTAVAKRNEIVLTSEELDSLWEVLRARLAEETRRRETLEREMVIATARIRDLEQALAAPIDSRERREALRLGVLGIRRKRARA